MVSKSITKYINNTDQHHFPYHNLSCIILHVYMRVYGDFVLSEQFSIDEVLAILCMQCLPLHKHPSIFSLILKFHNSQLLSKKVDHIDRMGGVLQRYQYEVDKNCGRREVERGEQCEMCGNGWKKHLRK